jgi:hypothetical protein
MDTEHGQACAEIARTMISEDTIDNALPADLTSWESLNDYCDANEYVADCVARHGIRAAAETVEAIERWLKSGRPLDIPQASVINANEYVADCWESLHKCSEVHLLGLYCDTQENHAG